MVLVVSSLSGFGAGLGASLVAGQDPGVLAPVPAHELGHPLRRRYKVCSEYIHTYARVVCCCSFGGQVPAEEQELSE